MLFIKQVLSQGVAVDARANASLILITSKEPSFRDSFCFNNGRILLKGRIMRTSFARRSQEKASMKRNLSLTVSDINFLSLFNKIALLVPNAWFQVASAFLKGIVYIEKLYTIWFILD